MRLKLRGAANDLLHHIDLDVHAGEIVGVAGLQGSGRTELARAIFGADPFDRGTFELDGKERRIGSPRSAVAAGIGFVTEDRKAEGLALSQSVRDNVSLAWRGLRRVVCAASTSSRSATWSRRSSCASAASARRSASSPAATSRRSCSPSGSPPSPGW